mmetsp:Transcript_39071/g.118022  ORF Transcript_39071/g.118022 Transcript_39071/m.118022 type:complete len:354 (+) Transcript_39071:38-1099(+)
MVCWRRPTRRDAKSQKKPELPPPTRRRVLEPALAVQALAHGPDALRVDAPRGPELQADPDERLPAAREGRLEVRVLQRLHRRPGDGQEHAVHVVQRRPRLHFLHRISLELVKGGEGPDLLLAGRAGRVVIEVQPAHLVAVLPAPDHAPLPDGLEAVRPPRPQHLRLGDGALGHGVAVAARRHQADHVRDLVDHVRRRPRLGRDAPRVGVARVRPVREVLPVVGVVQQRREPHGEPAPSGQTPGPGLQRGVHVRQHAVGVAETVRFGDLVPPAEFLQQRLRVADDCVHGLLAVSVLIAVSVQQSIAISHYMPATSCASLRADLATHVPQPGRQPFSVEFASRGRGQLVDAEPVA